MLDADNIIILETLCHRERSVSDDIFYFEKINLIVMLQKFESSTKMPWICSGIRTRNFVYLARLPGELMSA